MCPAGGNWKTLRRYALEVWTISVDHFQARRANPHAGRTPLEKILVQGSTFSRNHLKERLDEESVKSPVCELCGQDERWKGRRMGLILDHINRCS